jgi:uncharacterized protein (TIGR02145 family)
MKFTTYLFSIALLSICNVVQAQIRVACMAGDTIELNIAQARGAVQWQASADSLVWTDIPGANSEQIDYHPSAGIQWVRAAISESDCPPFYEHPVRLNAVDTTSAEFDPLIIVMDTVTVQFLPDSAEQAMGQYDFEVTGTNVSIDPGDILIGTEGRGFLVSVDYLIRSNNQLVIQTHRANLDDLFDDASLQLEMLMDSLEQRDFGVQLALNNVQIISDGSPNFSFPNFNYQLTGTSSWASLFSAAEGLTQLNMDCQLHKSMSGDISLTSLGLPFNFRGEHELANFELTNQVNVDDMPILYTSNVKLILKYDFEWEAGTCDLNSDFFHNADINYTMSYFPLNNDMTSSFTYQAWPGTDYSFFSNDDNGLSSPFAFTFLEFKTEVTYYFYDQEFLYLDLSDTIQTVLLGPEDLLYENFEKNILAGPMLKDSIDAEVFGASPPSTPDSQTFPLVFDYLAPFEIALISGSMQAAAAGTLLSEPVVVQVTDNRGEPVKDVKVTVEVLGGGSLQEVAYFTDEQGKVNLYWTLGNNALDFQRLNIHVYVSPYYDIQGSPLEVNANIISPCDGLTTITDSDGNTYPVVAIGNQCWTQTNLRTTHYSNSDEIPNVVDFDLWDWLHFTPAWAYYNNNPTYNDVYGKLYNWYAVSDSRNVCPVGWHVPSHTDWIELIDLLDTNATGDIFDESGLIYSLAGGSMKATGIIEDGTGLWESPNGDATNLSGFSALPGGFITNSGSDPMGEQGVFWSSSVYDETRANSMELNFVTGHVIATPSGFENGFSIRCLKDN